jgi:hypothetical protein
MGADELGGATSAMAAEAGCNQRVVCAQINYSLGWSRSDQSTANRYSFFTDLLEIQSLYGGMFS